MIIINLTPGLSDILTWSKKSEKIASIDEMNQVSIDQVHWCFYRDFTVDTLKMKEKLPKIK